MTGFVAPRLRLAHTSAMGRRPTTEKLDEDNELEGSTAAECLVLIHGCDPHAAAEIPLGDRVAIGRGSAPECDVTINDTRLSWLHATITRTAQGLVIDDHDSTNGTFVDGKRVERARLLVGTIIRLGESVFELQQRGPMAPVPRDEHLIGRSPPLQRLLLEIDRAAPSAMSILVIGETGTGKELLSRRLHLHSKRTGPLVPVNCGAIPANLAEAALFGHKKGAFTDARRDAPGYFEQAAGGTLFLDEIGVLPLEIQPKLLRVLENHEFFPVGATLPEPADVRVIAATNVDLRAEADAGRFRPDLYARLAEYTIHVPPLRERREDIPLLFLHYLDRAAQAHQFTLSSAFVEGLVLYDWPHNVRELRALAQRLSLLEDLNTVLKVAHLPSEIRTPPKKETADDPKRTPAKEDLEAMLQLHEGSVAKVAEHYGKQRMQVYRWLVRYGLKPEQFRKDDS